MIVRKVLPIFAVYIFSNPQGLLYMAEGRGCHKLVHVDMSGCKQLTPECLTCLGKATPQLQTIILSNIASLQDDALVGLSASCKHLRHVDLIGARALTDLGIKALAVHNRELRVFKLEENPHVTDGAVKALAHACLQLSHVHLANCGRLGDPSLRALGQLKHLQVSCSCSTSYSRTSLCEHQGRSKFVRITRSDLAVFSYVGHKISSYYPEFRIIRVRLTMFYCSYIPFKGII